MILSTRCRDFKSSGLVEPVLNKERGEQVGLTKLSSLISLTCLCTFPTFKGEGGILFVVSPAKLGRYIVMLSLRLLSLVECLT